MAPLPPAVASRARRRAVLATTLACLPAALLAQGYVPESGGPPGRDAALIRAAAAGDSAEVARLLQAGASVLGRDLRGRTALIAAAANGHVPVVRQLINAGANVNAQDDDRDTPLLIAGARGHAEVARILAAAGADLTARNRFGGTALIPAAHYGHVDTVRTLLQTSIDVNHVNDLGWTALLEAVVLGDGGPAHQEIVRLLLAHGAEPSKPDRDGVTPLAHARRRGQAAVAKLLESAGAR